MFLNKIHLVQHMFSTLLRKTKKLTSAILT